MSLWVLIPLSLIGIVFLAIVITRFWNPFCLNLTRSDFSDVIRGLMIGKENGSYLRLDSRSTGVWFSVERLRGSDVEATLSLRLSRNEKSERAIGELYRLYDSHGFRLEECEDNPSLIAKVTIPVDDIWAKNSGSNCSHAARLYLDVLGEPIDAKYKADDFGAQSRRMEKKEFFERI